MLLFSESIENKEKQKKKRTIFEKLEGLDGLES